MLLKHRDLIATLDLSKLKAFSIGSAVVPQELINSLERAFPGVKVKESYGLTEGGGPAREPCLVALCRGAVAAWRPKATK